MKTLKDELDDDRVDVLLLTNRNWSKQGDHVLQMSNAE